MFRRILWPLMGLLLTACTTPSAPVTQEPVPAVAASGEDDDDVLYHVLRGEMAARQGDLGQALKSYLSAARGSDDPRVAEQATRLAAYLGEREAAQEAARRWSQLAPDQSEPLEIMALLELRAGDSQAALARLREALALDGANPAAGFERLADVLAREKNQDAALELLTALAADYPDQLSAQMAVANLALRLQRPEQALAAAERGAALAPEAVEPALAQVRARLQMGQGDAAVKLLEQVIKRHPSDYDLRLEYARTLLSLERVDGAARQFDILLKQRPDDTQLLYAAALLSIEVGDVERARSYLLKLVNAEQRVNEAYYYLGRLAQSEGDLTGAMRWYRRVEGDFAPDAQLRVAMALAAQDNLAAARAKLAEVRRDYPEAGPRSYLAEGEIHQTRKDLPQALEAYSAGLQAYPDNWELRYARGLTAAQLGHVPQAEADLRALLAKQPDNASVLNALGYTLVDRTDRYQEGAELIQQAYALRPDDAAIIDSMGWAAFRLGRLEEARDYLQQAYQLNPEEPEIAAHLVEALWQLGERKQALQVLREALKQAPKDPMLLELKKRLR